MCGIVGLVNGAAVAEDLLAALGRLEYRGYDSAGVALSGSPLLVRKALGRARDLAPEIAAAGPTGHAGIGHTRWATHGRPALRNAHPHAHGGVAVVHNGIVGNHAALRARLAAAGHAFVSDTDSEVIPHLVAAAMARGADPLAALAEACDALEGSFAIAMLAETAPDTLFVACRASPLVVALGEGMAAAASDPMALAGLPLRYAALADGEVAALDQAGLRFAAGRPAAGSRRFVPVAAGPAPRAARFGHDTRREIAEQPAALRATAAALAPRALPRGLAAAERLLVLACGSSLCAAGTARDAIERATGLPVELEVASEFRDRCIIPSLGTLPLLVSQSGETADTLAALERLRRAGRPSVAVVNVADSAIGRGAELLWPTAAGPELGVAATKSFTAQLYALTEFGLRLGRLRGSIAPALEAALVAALDGAPGIVGAAEIAAEVACIAVARRIAAEGEAIFIGRGAGAALAAEGALKLKELSYLRAEGYAAGELKHGPIALIREGSPVVAIAPGGPALPRLLANVSAVRARGAWVLALTDEAGEAACREAGADEVLVLPGDGPEVAPFAAAVALQLIAYHAALALGRDVDRPRNLAKSVTVE